MTYSMDLRERVVAALEAGEPIAVVGRRFGVARPTVRDWWRRYQRGALSPQTPGPKGPVKLTAADEALMREMLRQRPGITARQLMEHLSVDVVESTVCRAIKRLGLSLKKSR